MLAQNLSLINIFIQLKWKSLMLYLERLRLGSKTLTWVPLWKVREQIRKSSSSSTSSYLFWNPRMHLLCSLYRCSWKSTITPRRLHPLPFTLIVNSVGESKCFRRSRYTAAQANFLLSERIVASKERTYWPARITKMSSWRKNTTRNNTVPVDSNAFQGQNLQTSKSKSRWDFRKTGLLIPELERDGETVILL